MINGHDFIRLAGKLCVLQKADEASYRSAVSRAYYGAFHLVQQFLHDLGFAHPQNVNSHGFLQHQLVNSGHPEAMAAGTALRDLHKERIRADYDLNDDEVGTRDYTKRLVELAHRVSTLLAACAEEPARSRIHNGIADYQSKLP